ncbi:hypothetical protein BH09VER1_BH09VER1_26200 [soil metagenome]
MATSSQSLSDTEAEETFRSLASDPANWLEQAEGSLLSADIIYAALQEVMPQSQTLSGIREKKLAFMQSYMLLTAIAFENLLKGLAVVDDPDGWKKLKADSGHGISVFAAQLANPSDEERDVLKRLQEYLIWAGRYTIPLRVERYVFGSQLRSLKQTDRQIIKVLFEKLAATLRGKIGRRSVEGKRGLS